MHKYHEGYLVADCSDWDKTKEQMADVRAARVVRQRYWDAYNRGEVLLVQRRLGFHHYEYLSTREV